jgi:hypothetical protein
VEEDELMAAMQKCDFTRGPRKKYQVPAVFPMAVPKLEVIPAA